MHFTVLKTGQFDGNPVRKRYRPSETREAARAKMRRLVRDCEKANGYRLPEYGGEDDCEQSVSVSEDIHVYEFNDCTGDHFIWEVVALEEAR